LLDLSLASLRLKPGGGEKKAGGLVVNRFVTTPAEEGIIVTVFQYFAYTNQCLMVLRNISIFLLVVFGNLSLYAQNKIDTSALKKELAALYERDQKTRKNGDSSLYMSYIDSCNQVQAEKLIQKYGWLGKGLVGSGGNTALFAVIQHANLETQERYFPLLQKSVADGESNAFDMALMQDRILMRKEKKQIYGSQIVLNKTTGAWEFYPIEDELNVNKRRASVGLESIEEYAKHFGIDYKLPTDK
jgi:hypothetical protein